MSEHVDVWFATVDGLPSSYETLSHEEIERAGGYRFDADRRRFVAGARLLRAVIADEIGDGDVPVDRTCPRCARPHGRPRVVGHDVHVSVAHADDVVAVAVCRTAPVGVDVERVAAVDAATVATVARAWPGDDGSVVSPAQVWTRLEAVLKADGSGFTLDPLELRFAPDGIVDWPGRRARWVDVEIDVAPGYAAAIAWLAVTDLEVRRRDVASLRFAS